MCKFYESNSVLRKRCPRYRRERSMCGIINLSQQGVLVNEVLIVDNFPLINMLRANVLDPVDNYYRIQHFGKT